ncbi:MAG: hypothetical protein WB808_04050 [Candidatus Dormiibacterota bacterium]
MTDAEEIVSILIDEARAQIALQSSNADSHDTKALALLGADIAAGLAVISLHAVQTASVPPSIFDRYWWVPVVGAAFSAIAFSFTLWNRDFRIGPAPDTFYANHIFQTSFAAKYALLTDLSIAITWNNGRVRSKGGGWIVGACGMVATALGWLVIWAVVK